MINCIIIVHTGIIFTAEPRDLEVQCGADAVAKFQCQYEGSVAHPYWIINSTILSSVKLQLPSDHSYSDHILTVTNLNQKDGTTYQCLLLSEGRDEICAYHSTIGQLTIACKGSNFSIPAYL